MNETEMPSSHLDTAPQTSTLFAAQPTVAAASAIVAPQACNGGCSGSGNTTEPPVFIYAIGRIDARFPSIAVEKEFIQATARTETKGKTDQQSFYAVLSQRENRYLVRQMCWVFTVQGLETYLLRPRDAADLDLLVEAIRPAPSPADIDVVIGLRGPIAPPDMCNGLMVPIVMFDQVYSFDRDTLIKAIPKPEKIAADAFRPAAQELFDRVMQMTDNAGATDEHRALNYLSMRYHAVYATVAECHGRDCALTGVEVQPSRLSTTRRIMDVVFSFNHRKTDVSEKYFVRVDVSEEFPYLVTKMSPYYDR